MYDAIVVGARCAGSPTAMLLARKGYRVLLLDRATFPSDTISTHIVWQPGGARLERWGLLERVRASGCPPQRGLGFDLGDIVLFGQPPAVDGVKEYFAPRRKVLDKILVDAAVEAGAELRERFAVHELCEDEGRVTGVRGRTERGSAVTEQARIVIGADGRNSMVANTVKPPKYKAKPPLTCWFYSYWSGIKTLPTLFARDGRAFGSVPTNDGLHLVTIGWPNREFHEFRSDIEKNVWRTLDLVPEFADAVRRGKREERFVGTGSLPNFFRKPFGPGWALVGDAGYHKDPITAQGISDAFLEAELLADAVDAGLSGRQGVEQALQDYEKRRNEEVMPRYEFACDMARLDPPPPERRQLFAALQGNREGIDRFLGTISGATDIPQFFSAENVQALMGTTAT